MSALTVRRLTVLCPCISVVVGGAVVVHQHSREARLKSMLVSTAAEFRSLSAKLPGRSGEAQRAFNAAEDPEHDHHGEHPRE
jgi:hypothetical protein